MKTQRELFLEELTALTRKYGLEVGSDGNSELAYLMPLGEAESAPQRQYVLYKGWKFYWGEVEK